MLYNTSVCTLSDGHGSNAQVCVCVERGLQDFGYHYTKVTFVRACVCVYEREVTGSHSTRGKEVFFLGIGGLGNCY